MVFFFICEFQTTKWNQNSQLKWARQQLTRPNDVFKGAVCQDTSRQTNSRSDTSSYWAGSEEAQKQLPKSGKAVIVRLMWAFQAFQVHFSAVWTVGKQGSQRLYATANQHHWLGIAVSHRRLESKSKSGLTLFSVLIHGITNRTGNWRSVFTSLVPGPGSQLFISQPGWLTLCSFCWNQHWLAPGVRAIRSAFWSLCLVFVFCTQEVRTEHSKQNEI